MLGVFDVGIPGLFRILEVGVVPAWTRKGRADAVDVMKMLFISLLDHVVKTTSEWPLTIELANVACFNGSLGKRWQEIFQSVAHDRLFEHLKVSFSSAKKSRIQQETLPDGWPSLLLEQGTSGNNSEAGEASQPAQQAATSSDGGVAVSQATATRAGGSSCSEERAISDETSLPSELDVFEQAPALEGQPHYVRIGVRPHYTPPDRSGVPTKDEWDMMCLGMKRQWLFGHYGGDRKWKSGGTATTVNCDAAHGIALEAEAVGDAEAEAAAAAEAEAAEVEAAALLRLKQKGAQKQKRRRAARHEDRGPSDLEKDCRQHLRMLEAKAKAGDAEAEAAAMAEKKVAEKKVAWLGVAWCGVTCRGLV
jgi:hypothetical protein